MWPSIEGFVVPRDRIIQWFKMCEDRRVQHDIANVVFDTFNKLMATLDRPITWNKHV